MNCNQSFCYGYATNKDIRESASGGIAFALYENLLNKGGIVYGVSWTSEFRSAQYVRITKKDELELLRGSKYVKAKMQLKDGESVYNKIYDDLCHNNKVLFIGLPCEVNGLARFLENKNCSIQNLILVDMVCHGPTSDNVLMEFVTSLEKKYNSRIKYINLRYKNPSWGKQSYVKVVFENNKSFIKELWKTEFGIAFDIYGCEMCYSCLNKGNNRMSDITIGDHWGISEDDPNYNFGGVSIVIMNSLKGKEIISNMSNICLYEGNEVNILKNNPYYYKPRIKNEKRDKFEKFFRKYGLSIACKMTVGLRKYICVYCPTVYKMCSNLKKIVVR